MRVWLQELSSEARKSEFETKMVNHRGVVSFWCDLNQVRACEGFFVRTAGVALTECVAQQKAVVRTSLTEDGLVKAIMAQLGWIASVDPGFVSPSNAGYAEDEIGQGAIVSRTKQSKKAKESQANGGGWFSSVTSYLW